MRAHLLVATDFSMPAKRMLSQIDEFRSAGAEKITLVHIEERRLPMRPSDGEDQYYRELLREAADDLRSRGWEVDDVYVEGRPGSAIVATAGDVGAEMIVMANHGHSAMSEVLLGSVATDVLERADRPVFLFNSKKGAAPLWDRVVHPTDFSKVADRAFGYAQELALADGRPLVLLHAVDPRFEGEHRAEQAQQNVESRAKKAREAGVVEVEGQVIEGSPKKVVLEAGEHYPGALFVMGARGRGWFGNLMFGGVSRAMARRGTHHLLFIYKSS